MNTPFPRVGIPAQDEVHVWRFGLDLPSTTTIELERMLAPDEMERAGNFQFPLLRNRFITGRGIVRLILHRYLNVEPGLISFNYGLHGKPFLSELDKSVAFNLAHSEDQAVFAVARQPVGIDLEQIRSDLELESMAASFFTVQEQAAFLSSPQKINSFFRIWVRKEAFMKATGTGFTSSPVTIPSSEEVSGIIHYFENVPWKVYDLKVEDDFLAALVVAGDNNHKISYFNLTESATAQCIQDLQSS